MIADFVDRITQEKPDTSSFTRVAVVALVGGARAATVGKFPQAVGP